MAFYCTRITWHHTIERITTTEWYELTKGDRFHRGVAPKPAPSP